MGMVPGQKSISAVIHAYINTGLLLSRCTVANKGRHKTNRFADNVNVLEIS